MCVCVEWASVFFLSRLYAIWECVKVCAATICQCVKCAVVCCREVKSVSVVRDRNMCKGFPVNHYVEQQTCQEEFRQAKHWGFSHCDLLTLHVWARLSANNDSTASAAHIGLNVAFLNVRPVPPTSRSRVDGTESQPSQTLCCELSGG